MKKEAYGKEIKFGIVQNIVQMLVRYFVQKKWQRCRAICRGNAESEIKIVRI